MARYSVADWYGVVTPGGMALLPRTVPLSAVERVWQALKDGSGPGAAIEGLVGAFGAGLRNLPDFALLTRAGDDVRVALRGAVEARLWRTGATTAESHSGSGVSTWTEQLIADVERAELSVAGEDGECTLLITDGVVLAGRIAFWGGDSAAKIPGEAVSFVDEPAAPAGENLPWAPAVQEPAPASDRSAPAGEPPGAEAFFPWQPVAKRVPEAELAAAFEAPPAVEAPQAQIDVLPEPQSPEPEPEAPEARFEVVAAPPEPTPDVPAPTAEPTKVYPSLDVLDSADAEAVAADAFVPEPSVSAEVLAGPESADDAGAVARSAETMTAEDAPNDYDRLLFGETVLSSVEDAAVRLDGDGPGGEPGTTVPPPPPPFASPVAPPPPPPAAGLIAQVPAFPAGAEPPAETPWADHDGQTVLVQALGADPRMAAALAAAAPPPTPPAWRPPTLRVAGQPPLLLDRSAVVGVRPRFTRVQDGLVPHLVTVQSPKGEISRSHVELRLEGHTLLAVDLNSTNGTMLLRQAADPVRLHPGEPSILVPGDRIDLGDGVVLEFEGIE